MKLIDKLKTPKSKEEIEQIKQEQDA